MAMRGMASFFCMPICQQLSWEHAAPRDCAARARALRRFERDAAIAATLRALQADPTVTAVTLNSSVKNSVGLFEATIGFRLAAGTTPN